MAYKRSGKYYTDIRPRGPDSKPTGERIRKLIPKVRFKWEADKAERQIAARLLHGNEKVVRAPIFEDFVNDIYLPWARENKKAPDHDEFRAKVLCLSPHFRGRRMDEFSVIQFEGFKRDRLKSTTRYGRARSAGTINAELTIARSIFRRAVVEGITTRNPARDTAYLDTPPFRTRRLAVDEEQRLFAELRSCPNYIYAVSIIALNTGMRAGEIARIHTEDVDFARDTLFLREAKWTRDKRLTEGIPLNPTVRALLWQLCKQKRGRLFENTRQGILTTANISSLFRYACQRAKVTGFRFHDLRHEFGSRLGDKGYSPYDIARLMGHADIKMTAIYVHPHGSNLKKAVSDVDSRTFGHSADTKRGERSQNAAPKELKAQTM